MAASESEPIHIVIAYRPEGGGQYFMNYPVEETGAAMERIKCHVNAEVLSWRDAANLTTRMLILRDEALTEKKSD